MIWGIVVGIVEAVVDFIKEYWWVIIIILVIWYAPNIAFYLGEVGAPEWLVTGAEWLANSSLRTWVVSAGNWLGETISSTVSDLWGAMELTDKMIAVVGAGVLLAPEETAVFIEETAAAVEQIIEPLVVAGLDIVSTASGAFFSSPLGIGVLAVGGLFLLSSLSSKSK